MRSSLLISKVLIVKKQSVWIGVLCFTWRSFFFVIANLYFVDALKIVFDVINSYFVSFFIHKYGKTSFSRMSSHKSMTYKFITIIFKCSIRILSNHTLHDRKIRHTFFDIDNLRKIMSFVKLWNVTFLLLFFICFRKQTNGHAISTMKNYFSAYFKNNPKVILSFYHHKVRDADSCF